MATIKLDFVHAFTDARGKLRHVFRRKGHKRTTIKGRSGAAEFMDAYHALLVTTGGALSEIGASRIKTGTIDALIVRYLKHDSFIKGLAKTTQNVRRPILDAFGEFETPCGRRYGENHLKTTRRQDVIAVLDGETPHTQKTWLKALRGLIVFGIAQSECTRSIPVQASSRRAQQQHRPHDMEAAADRAVPRASRARHHGKAGAGIDAERRGSP